MKICKFCNKREIRYDDNFCSLECYQQNELTTNYTGWKWIKLEERVSE